ncbi:MAG: hypothetical protein WCX23_03675 [Candidatus Paceibacterota bacterium]|jgi:hypothetical protein|nr:hypothetical protein [Candidatus Paceibacterota bacterium]MDD4831144.1 hypothetical protein [Candidatus Paceibacterota bacterium]MDD4875473.1 hypothetical protein [Candidatus Paceibacterota bacterium]
MNGRIFQSKKEAGGVFWDVIFTLFFFFLAMAMIFKYDSLIEFFKGILKSF